MIVLSASGLTKAYGQDVIIEDVSFHINAGERIGIVGRNGAGKTTLINMLTGELKPDEGDYFVAKDKEIGYLKQRDYFDPNNSIIDEVSGLFSHLDKMEREMEDLNHRISVCKDESEEKALWKKLTDMQNLFEREGGYTYRSEITGVLTAMGFGAEVIDMMTGSLSGGERTRLALACLLLKTPDILLLDEPTNHLDIGSLKWLEQYLRSYLGTMILVSHDRYFLDSIVTGIFEIEGHKLKSYKGNYTEFAAKKKALMEAGLRAYKKQEKEIRRQEDLIRGYKERGTEKLAKRALSREKRLSHIERLEKTTGPEARMKISFHQKYQSGNDVVLADNISFGYEGGRSGTLFDEVSLDIKRGERISIIGDNGTGKTTLLKVLMGELDPIKGYIKYGHNVELGYYDQGQLLLNDGLTVMDEIHNEYRLYTDGEIRNILGRFLFRGDDVFKAVGSLSGGEKARLALLKLMLSGANLLILDEPTNHLDIESKEVFEDALIDYPGTVITVSHDRYFLNKIPTRILELSEGRIIEYLGKYDYYLEKKKNMESGREHMKSFGNRDGAKNKDDDKSLSSQLSVKAEREEKKKAEAVERKRKRDMENLIKRIEELEDLISKNEEEMCKPENLSNHEKLGILAREVDDWKADLDYSYGLWMDLAEGNNSE